MNLSYEKLGIDHEMYGKAEYIVMDGLNQVCYKTATGYQPIGGNTTSAHTNSKASDDTKPFYVLNFLVNGETEEKTFKSKKKLDKTISLFKTKAYISNIEFTTYQMLK